METEERDEIWAGRPMYFADRGCQHPGLQACIKAIIVKDEKTVILFLEEGHCADMTGAIQLAKNISADVEEISTWSGIDPDTVYRKIGGGWEAFERDREQYKSSRRFKDGHAGTA